MAVTGKFIGDFSSFTDAVKKANVSLDSLETNSGKVQSALQRMTTQFQGQKLIQDALLATQAVKNIGGATALTEAEQRKLNTQLTEAIAKYRALGQTAPKDMLDLAKATAQVPKQLTLADQAMGVLKSSFGQFTAAGLATQAISAATQEVSRFVAEGLKLGGLESSFRALSTAAKVNGDEMLAAMRTATRGLVSQYDLLGAANKAMLLGLPVTAQEMGELSTAAVALGRAMGMDATKSLNDFVEAVGKGSPEILNNFGIIVKAEEAYAAYAATVGKIPDALSAAEKQLAVYTAAMEAARQKTKELGEQSLTVGEIATSVWTQFGNEVSTAVAYANKRIGEYIAKAQRAWELTKGLATGSTPLPPLPPSPLPAPAGPAPPAAIPRDYVAELAAAEAATRKLTAAQREQYAAAVKAGASTDELTRVFGLNATAQRLMAEATRDSSRARKDATSAADALVKRVEAEDAAQHKIQLAYGRTLQSLQGYIKEHRVAAQVISATIPADVSAQWTTWTARINDNAAALKRWGGVAGAEMNRNAAEASRFFDTLRAETAKAAQFGERFATTLLSGIQSGNVGKTVGGFLGGEIGSSLGKTVGDKLGGVLGSKMGSMVGGMLGPLGAAAGQLLGDLAGKLAGKLGGLFGKGAGRSMVEDFAASQGGFDALQKKIEALGEAGAGLWVKLTQGVPKNNKEAAAAAIAEVEAALDKAGETAEEAADQVGAATEEQAQATIETATEAAKALEELGPKIKANEEEWKSWGAAVTAQIQAIADRIRDMPMPPVLSAPQAASGIAATDVNARGGAGGGVAVLNVDGRELARAVVPAIPGVVKRYGLA